MTDLYSLLVETIWVLLDFKSLLACHILIASTITFHIKRADNLSMNGSAGMATLKYAKSQIQILIQVLRQGKGRLWKNDGKGRGPIRVVYGQPKV